MWNRLLVAVILASMICGLVPPVWASSVSATAVYGHKRDHSCCPHGASKSAATLAQSVPALPPCGGTAPCCVQPRPENPPALPSVSNVLRPELKAMPATIDDDPLPDGRWLATEARWRDAFEFYSVRSTVLRN